MASELRVDKTGGRFLVVTYNNQLSNWGACLAEAYRQHPGCKNLPTIAVSDMGRFDVGGERVRKQPLEAPQPPPRRARNDERAEGIHTGTPKGNNAENASFWGRGWEGRWEKRNLTQSGGQQMSLNYSNNNNNSTGQALN